jgi:hypothetical protein
MIFNFFNETVEIQRMGSILPLSIKFFVARQRILNFSCNFGASSLIRITFFNYSDGIINLSKKFSHLFC